jgi:hypothetical protein
MCEVQPCPPLKSVQMLDGVKSELTQYYLMSFLENKISSESLMRIHRNFVPRRQCESNCEREILNLVVEHSVFSTDIGLD